MYNIVVNKWGCLNFVICYTSTMIKEEKNKEKKIKPSAKISSAVPSLEEMLKAGVHFGHKKSRSNPKMKPYIFAVRDSVHVIDLEKTLEKLKEALKFLEKIKKEEGKILFIGTKVVAKDIVKEVAQDCKMPYVTERWLGGTLSNFDVIAKRLEHFRDLEKQKKTGELKKYTKKEQHEFNVELSKLERRFGGIKNLTKLPDALFIVDIANEKLAVKESKIKEIPSIGLCDSNGDPGTVDFPIPANDDAISSLKLILESVAKILK